MNHSHGIVIRSPSNPAVRRLIRLRDNRRRRQAGRILVDGWRECCRAVESGLRPVAIYVDHPPSEEAHGVDRAAVELDEGDRVAVDRVEGDGFRGTIGAVLDAAEHVQLVTSEILQRISYGQNARGVVGEFAAPQRRFESIELSDRSCVLVLDSIEKPGNLGAVFRSADAAGVDAVLLTGEQGDLFNPNAIRGSLGTVFSVPSASGDRQQVSEYLLANGFQICAARVESSQLVWDAAFQPRVAIVMGSEAEGLGKHWQSRPERPVEGIRIPMMGHADSLNLSVSAALLMFEVTRRNHAISKSGGNLAPPDG